VSTTYVYRCMVCDWEPDPKRRMDPYNQMEAHGNEAGHPCEMRLVTAGEPGPETESETSPR
jgi:hypothetical protein